MNTQPEALYLADNADKTGAHRFAAELRRLHEENERLKAQQPAQHPTNCRHCGGAANVICSGQCKEQPAQQQEPSVWTATRLWNRKDTWTCPADIEKDLLDGCAPPAQHKPWVGLTDEERDAIASEYKSSSAAALMTEAKLREKNA